MSKLPDIIKIDDVASGKIDPALIYNELERLKVEINLLRNDMALFIKALATISSHQNQHDYYRVVVSRLKTVQLSIKEYCAQYNKLLPIINLAQIKLGHEVEIVPQRTQSISNNSNGTNSLPTPAPTANSTSNSTGSPNTTTNSNTSNNPNTSSGFSSSVSLNSATGKKKLLTKPPQKQARPGNNANQPIVL